MQRKSYRDGVGSAVGVTLDWRGKWRAVLGWKLVVETFVPTKQRVGRLGETRTLLRWERPSWAEKVAKLAGMLRFRKRRQEEGTA